MTFYEITKEFEAKSSTTIRYSPAGKIALLAIGVSLLVSV